MRIYSLGPVVLIALLVLALAASWVVPDLTSPHGYTRNVVAWILETFQRA
jgi:hypothetical protein